MANSFPRPRGRACARRGAGSRTSGERARRRRAAPQLLAADLEADGFGRAAEGGECRCCSCRHRGLGRLLVTKGARTLKQKKIWIREKSVPRPCKLVTATCTVLQAPQAQRKPWAPTVSTQDGPGMVLVFILEMFTSR